MCVCVSGRAVPPLPSLAGPIDRAVSASLGSSLPGPIDSVLRQPGRGRRRRRKEREKEKEKGERDEGEGEEAEAPGAGRSCVVAADARTREGLGKLFREERLSEGVESA